MKNIDKKDILILQALDKNPRMSYTQIGKYAKISKETAQYRFNRLVSKGILKGFWLLPKVGKKTHVYKVLLKSKGLSNNAFDKIKEFLLDSKIVAWMAICNGYWNIHLTLISDDDSEISLLLKELFTTYSSFFVDIQFHKTIGAYIFPEKYLYEKNNPNYIYESFLGNVPETDDVDKKILDLLSINGRSTFTELGNKLKLTPEAILQRFKKLKESIVSVKPRIDHSKLGLSYYHLWIRLSDGSMIKDIISYCIKDKNNVFIMEHVGKYNLHIEVVCEEDNIDKYLSDLMQNFDKTITEYDLCKISSELKIRVNK